MRTTTSESKNHNDEHYLNDELLGFDDTDEHNNDIYDRLEVSAELSYDIHDSSISSEPLKKDRPKESEDELISFYHDELKIDVVAFSVATKLIGLSLQTIYNRISDGRDQELVDNLVLDKYISPSTQKTKKRYFLKLSFVLKRMKELDPPIRDLKEDISVLYYKSYELLEESVETFSDTKNSNELLVNMGDIDRIIAAYIIGKADELLGHSLTPRKATIIRFAISSFYFSSYKEAKFILEALHLFYDELTVAKKGESDD